MLNILFPLPLRSGFLSCFFFSFRSFSSVNSVLYGTFFWRPPPHPRSVFCLGPSSVTGVCHWLTGVAELRRMAGQHSKKAVGRMQRVGVGCTLENKFKVSERVHRWEAVSALPSAEVFCCRLDGDGHGRRFPRLPPSAELPIPFTSPG